MKKFMTMAMLVMAMVFTFTSCNEQKFFDNENALRISSYVSDYNMNDELSPTLYFSEYSTDNVSENKTLSIIINNDTVKQYSLKFSFAQLLYFNENIAKNKTFIDYDVELIKSDIDFIKLALNNDNVKFVVKDSKKEIIIDDKYIKSLNVSINAWLEFYKNNNIKIKE